MAKVLDDYKNWFLNWQNVHSFNDLELYGPLERDHRVGDSPAVVSPLTIGHVVQGKVKWKGCLYGVTFEVVEAYSRLNASIVLPGDLASLSLSSFLSYETPCVFLGDESSRIVALLVSEDSWGVFKNLIRTLEHKFWGELYWLANVDPLESTNDKVIESPIPTAG